MYSKHGNAAVWLTVSSVTAKVPVCCVTHGMVYIVPVRFCLFLTGNVLDKVMKPPSVRYRVLAPGNSVPVGFGFFPCVFGTRELSSL